MPQTPTTVDRAYGRTDARSGRSGGSAKSGKSAAFRRDSSLAGFIKRLRDVEILSDVALGKIRASGHKMPGDLEAFQKRKDEVLRCVDEMKGQLRCYKCSRTHRVLPVYPLSLVIRRFAGSRADPEWESFRRDVQGVEVHEQVHRRVQ